ncbi:MAG: PAS domain-containing protein [Deltaproteobacteria bacterium]|nr:PAS domain-containing protein [Deltaproteobacteria bacterium]
MEDRVKALEAECAELRRQLADAQRVPPSDAAAFLESLLGAVPAFICRIDADMRLLYINRLLPASTMEDVLGRDIFEFVHPDSVADARACILNVLATGSSGAYEVIAAGPDGCSAHYETVVTPLADPSGLRGACLVSVDVTRLHSRDLALRRSEEELRVAIEATGIGLWSWTPATNAVHWYPRTHEVYGRAKPVDLMDYIDGLAHPDDRDMLRANMASSIAGGPFSGPIHRIITDDGSIRWILSRGRTELDANGRPARMIGGSLDVTQQHELEERLRHAQRLDAVGHLTAGIAHNFNNMLTVMVCTLEVLAKRMPGSERSLIDGALDTALSSAEMVRQLLTFTGHRAPADRRPRDIRLAVEQVVTMCRNTFARQIDLVCTIAPGLPWVRCTPNEIEQVLMNLLVNARDAVTERGHTTPVISITVDAHDASSLEITITDDGIGMTEDIARRAFDPFFSTKVVGGGTGLGLATSYAIVRELAGTFTCTSTPGAGTTMKVCLPGTAAVPVECATRKAAAPSRGRVLLVDDDAAVRTAISSLLASEGFGVEAVASGEAGLAHLVTRPPLDCILLDRSMPGAAGETFVPRIRALAPLVPILMFTGQAVAPEIAALVDCVVLKPVSGPVLVEAISALVRQRASNVRVHTTADACVES